MIRVEATIKGDDHFPFASVSTGSGQVNLVVKPPRPGVIRPVVAHELSLSGTQLLVGCVCFLGVAKILLWAFLKLWLFEP
jgi:hypothetical protein